MALDHTQYRVFQPPLSGLKWLNRGLNRCCPVKYIEFRIDFAEKMPKIFEQKKLPLAGI